MRLSEAGMPQDHPALQKAATWLLSKQTKTVADWIISSPGAEPGGWYFQFENEQYPDVDDSAVVLMALAKVRLPDEEQQRAAIRRGCRWVVSMQGSDGGWGAYDVDNNKIVFNYIPFADHRALLDPSTADLAGRCLEMLATLGYDWTHPSVASALAFVKEDQEQDGSWYGRWGVNYIYGTWSVLSGLRAIGEDVSSPYIRRAVNWVESKQNPDGGWGESCLSYANVSQSGHGESTPSQTAWALLALMMGGVTDSFSLARGIHYLIRNQRKDGSWEEVRHTRDWIPSRVLSSLPLVLPIFSPLGSGHVPQSQDSWNRRGQMNCESRPIEQDSFGPHADAVGASLPTFLTICDREHA